MIIIQIVLSSCRSARTIIVPEYHNDTVREVISRRDSVWLHDSVFVSDRGDTIRIERWRTKYVERTVRDTMYRSRRDSVRVPVEVPVVSPKGEVLMTLEEIATTLSTFRA